MQQWTDPYEIRARILPAVIVTLPVTITVLALTLWLLPGVSELIVGLLASGTIMSALTYSVSFVVRHCGESAERTLWQSWGGAPSTRFLRWRDQTLGKDIKLRLRSVLETECHTRLLSEEEESSDPVEADHRIIQAFREVRAVIRRVDPEGLWKKHDAEYGFHRNLYGSRVFWVIIAVTGSVISGAIWWRTGERIIAAATVADLLLIVWAVAWGWLLSPTLAKEAAESYAESAWTTFLVHARDAGRSGLEPAVPSDN